MWFEKKYENIIYQFLNFFNPANVGVYKKLNILIKFSRLVKKLCEIYTIFCIPALEIEGRMLYNTL